MDRGKVIGPVEFLKSGKEFGRYLDVDGDGVAYRTYPGTHPTRGAFFTRGSSKDAFARYTEEGAAYVATCSGRKRSSGRRATWYRFQSMARHTRRRGSA